MPNRTPLVMPHPRIAAVTARIRPFEDLCCRGRPIDPKAPPKTALTSTAESLHGDKCPVFTDIRLLRALTPRALTPSNHVGQ
jgi:hypothetical protein